MYQPSTTLVCTQGKELGCTVVQGSVLHAQLVDSCQPELISCTLVEEFQDLPTPGEFLDLGLVDFVAPNTIGGRVTSFLKKLGESNSWPLGTQCGQERVSDRMGTKACAVKASSSANVQPRVWCSGKPGGNGDVGKRSDYNSSASSGTVHKYVIPGWEERRWFQTGHKFEKAKPSGEVRTLIKWKVWGHSEIQSRRKSFCPSSTSRCVLYDTNASEGSQVFACSMEGEAVRVPGASFWPLFSPKSVHSGYESADSFFEEGLLSETWCT